MRLVFVLLAILWAAPAFAQTNCDNPPTTVVMGPNPLFYTRIPNFNTQEPNGSFQVTDLQYALFAANADPNTAQPVQGPTTVPRTAVKLDAAPDCYVFSAPTGIPTSQQLGASYKTHRAASAGITELFSAYATPVSNSFGVAASALPAPSRLIVR